MIDYIYVEKKRYFKILKKKYAFQQFKHKYLLLIGDSFFFFLNGHRHIKYQRSKIFTNKILYNKYIKDFWWSLQANVGCRIVFRGRIGNLKKKEKRNQNRRSTDKNTKEK